VGAMRTGPLLAIALACLAWPRPAPAYRPFDGTDAAVAERGEVEIELGPVGFVREGPARAIVAPALVLNWGFADRFELVLEGRHLVRVGGAPGPRSRLQDTALSVKCVLREGSLQERTGPSVATEISALLPTVGGEPGAGALLTVIASHRWPALTVHLNGAAAWTRAHRLGLLGGVILEVHDAWAVRPVAELLVEGAGGQPTAVSGLVGAIWRVREGLALDVGFRLARAGGADTVEVRAGLTWGFDAGFPRRGTGHGT